jgi:hypothetical protein
VCAHADGCSRPCITIRQEEVEVGVVADGKMSKEKLAGQEDVRIKDSNWLIIEYWEKIIR